MLTRSSRQRGVTLIELMIGLAIIAFMLAVGAPSFSTWIQNTRIRNAAELIKNGIQFAQTEALHRNTPVRFQLTSTLDASCTLSTSNANYVVNVGDTTTNSPAGACNTAPSETNAPFIIRTSPATDGMQNVVVNSSRSTVVFNSYGRVIPTNSTAMTIDLTASGGTCSSAAGGTLTCLRLVVSPGGQIKMCNPNPAVSPPQGC